MNDTVRLLYAAESCANLHIPCPETGSRAHGTRCSQNQRFGQVATVIPHAFVSLQGPLQGVSVTPHCRALHTPAYNMRQQGTGPVVGALRAKVWAGCYCNTTGIRAPWICAWFCTTAHTMRQQGMGSVRVLSVQLAAVIPHALNTHAALHLQHSRSSEWTVIGTALVF